MAHLNDKLSTLMLNPVGLTAYEKLKQTRLVANQLHLLPWNTTVITVGGTNGKGSVVACLESILVKAGYRVGAFTSPHLFQFNERIRINQTLANDDIILNAFNAIETAVNQIGPSIQLSYFQYSFLAAMLIFQQANLDIIILEVGIGGRYDAVNIIDADVSVIASIDLDHTEILGNDREVIGYDKAGIMRSHKPIICGDFNPPVSLIEYAKKINALFYSIQKNFFIQKLEQDWVLEDENSRMTYPLPKILLQNAAVAIMAIKKLPTPYKISEKAIKEGLTSIQLLGRCQLVSYKNRSVLFDVAHNPAAIKQLGEYIKSLGIKGKIFAVVGMVKEKDIRQSLSNLTSIVDQWLLVPLNSPRRAPMERLTEAVERQTYHIYKNSMAAFEDILQKSKKNDLIVVFGSFLLVGDLLSRSL